MKASPAIATHLCAIGIGLLVGLCARLSWRPVPVWPDRVELLAVDANAGEITVLPALVPDHLRALLREDLQSYEGFNALTRDDMLAALSAIEKHPAPEWRQYWLGCLFRRWAALDHTEALRQVLLLESPQMRIAALGPALSDWAQQYPRAAWDWVLALRDPALQCRAIERLIAELAPRQPAVYAGWAQQLSDPFLRRHALDQVAKVWASTDPTSVLAWAQSQPDADVRRSLLSPPLVELCQTDPALALNAASAEPEPGYRRDLLCLVMRTAAYRSPSPVIDWIKHTEPSPDWQLPLAALGDTLANDPTQTPAISSLITHLPEGALRDAFASGSAKRWAALQRVAEARKALSSIGPGVERDEVVTSLGQ